MKCFVLFMCVSILLGRSLAQGETLKLGINRTNLAWVESKERQFEILDEIHALGVKSIRLAMPLPHLPTYEHIRYCNKLGVDVVLLVLSPEKDIYFDPGTPIRDGDDEVIYDLPPLSEINEDQFLTLFRYYMVTLREGRLKVEAVQLFNELNWAAFNGDLPLVEGGAFITDENYRDYEFVGQWAAGIRKYRLILKEARRIVDQVFEKEPQLKPKLVTCGYARPDDQFLAKVSGSVIDPSLFLDILGGRHSLAGSRDNAFRYADGVGVHMYPEKMDLDPGTGVETASYYIEKKLKPLIRNAGKDKPIYISEWGYAGWLNNVKLAEEDRLKQFRIFIRALESKPFSDLTFGEIMLFDYDIMPPFSVYQDGALTPAARIFEDRFERNKK
ncbi:hypothetical protein [Tichowtungia aerotolerans]|uniref:Glycoside hydrolase family 5 domain-containing protein n=1 Tax=Tichowtungia aerotolerans TaxID=2697043 RepID=A0A6P1ME06_9BACT|nr:hypothetical protein [Tichowtungia aerotolerans]QHI70794.1 hypothetical protein GT409_15545 [Tichowtungia aerotolerans]